MTGESTLADIYRLTTVLEECAPAAIAVSGGVDSLTLAFVAHRALDGAVTMFHAVSPAVPTSATARVERYAKSEHWKLEKIDAGEFDDARYMENPANRCFYCKSNLYRTISARAKRQLLSGTNLDDLSDWRPGLSAAEAYSVRHPFVEAGMGKAAVRAVASRYGLIDIAELPASPCLSSRVETGIRIVPEALKFIDGAERVIQRILNPKTVRCRIRRSGLVVELDTECHDNLDDKQRATVMEELRRLNAGQGILSSDAIEVIPYVRGGAFLRSPS